jgi:threonine dehydrogenase-like Zn-dependent dehydrogenase
MTSATVRAAVQVGAKKMEMRELDLPELPRDAGILRVLRAGICGADVPMYAEGEGKVPRILGHENVGVIEQLGDLAAEHWGVQVGDYVALEEYLPCGSCEYCRSGEFRACPVTEYWAGGLRYGSTKIDVWPGLWGGYAQFQYIHPRAVLHRVPDGVPPRMAAMALPLGNGFQWAVFDGGAGLGDTVIVQGPGQQGLACVVAAKAAGASTIISTGLARDGQRLEIAKKLGADHTIAVDEESLADRVKEITDGRGADLVIDASSGKSVDTFNNGIAALKRRKGRFMAASQKGKPLDGVAYDIAIQKAVNFKGVRGHSFQAVEMALDLMKQGTIDLELLSTHEYGLDGADEAVRLVGGEIRDAKGNMAIHVTIDPWKV